MPPLLSAFAPRPLDGKPLCVIAHTIKGKGISYMEDRAEWHHGVPNTAQYEQALQELTVK